MSDAMDEVIGQGTDGGNDSGLATGLVLGVTVLSGNDITKAQPQDTKSEESKAPVVPTKEEQKPERVAKPGDRVFYKAGEFASVVEATVTKVLGYNEVNLLVDGEHDEMLAVEKRVDNDSAMSWWFQSGE